MGRLLLVLLLMSMLDLGVRCEEEPGEFSECSRGSEGGVASEEVVDAAAIWEGTLDNSKAHNRRKPEPVLLSLV